jgi:hypothetical protein
MIIVIIRADFEKINNFYLYSEQVGESYSNLFKNNGGSGKL